MRLLINDVRKGQYRILDVHLYSDYQDEIDENLVDWEVTDMSATTIEILLSYKNPRKVSIGYKRDVLSVEVHLTEYENKQKLKLPRKILLEEMPGQMSSQTELEILEVC